MKSSWRSPDGGSSVARNTEIESCGAVFCARWGTGSTSIRSFHTVSRETVRKGVRAMLRAWIWTLFRDQNGPNGALWVPSRAQFRVPPGLFGQFQDEVRRMHLPRTRVNKDKRMRLRYILTTQLLPKDLQRQELAGCILL